MGGYGHLIRSDNAFLCPGLAWGPGTDRERTRPQLPRVCNLTLTDRRAGATIDRRSCFTAALSELIKLAGRVSKEEIPWKSHRTYKRRTDDAPDTHLQVLARFQLFICPVRARDALVPAVLLASGQRAINDIVLA